MRGGFGCSPCCGPQCDACTAVCTEPHSGTAFEVVYSRYFEGVEAGNPTDGYLTAEGDNDTSDPYDGMDGNGPWHQQVIGFFTLGGIAAGTTRFPCRVQVSFWRSSQTLGASTIPPPSATLTIDSVTVSVSEGAIVASNGLIIRPSDGAVAISSIPLVSGSGDRSTSNPKGNGPYISFQALCFNTTNSFSIQARVEWSVKKRQHIIYGLVNECYEDDTGGGPCATFCDGDPANNILYLTISNYTGPEPESGSPNGTYVLERAPGYCDFFRGGVLWGCGHNFDISFGTGPYLGGFDEARVGSNRISIISWQIVNEGCKILHLEADVDSSQSYCGTGVLHSGVGKIYVYEYTWFPLPQDLVPGAFDWEIEA